MLRVMLVSLAAGGVLLLGRVAVTQRTGSVVLTLDAPRPGDSTIRFSAKGGAPVWWGVAEKGARQAAERPVYPLKVSVNGRYLVDQRDRPWRIQADAAWLMSANATPQEVSAYLTTRSRQGFNAFYLMSAVHPRGYGAAPNAPRNHLGDQPFAKPGDFSTAATTPETVRYWTWIDSLVDIAAAHDMVVMLAYTYLGWDGGDQGWYSDVVAQPSRRALYDWGRWLGSRYKDRANIIWFGLGDFAPPAGSEGSLRTVAIADGIKSAGARQLFMAEPSPPDMLATDATDFARVLDMNSFYGYGPDGVGTVYETAHRARKISPPIPAWMQEGTYEYENNWSHFSAQPWDTRRARFWSVLAGATAGDGFGSRDVWQWSNIPGSLSSPGARYSTHAFSLFASLPWWDLEPSGDGAGFAGMDLVTDGQGTWGKLDYITAARTASRDWLLAYVPVMHQGPRTFHIDMTSLSGPARGRWFDPETGDYLAISDRHDLDNAGRRPFTTPGQRRDGTDDWLLVLDTNGSSACGSIDTSGRYAAPHSTPPGVTCEVIARLRSKPSVSARTTVASRR